MNKKPVLLCLCIFICSFLNAQVEVAHLSTKGFSAIGFGGFLNFAVPISDAESLTLEAGVYSFRQQDNHIILVPFLLGYRYTLDGSGSGIYVEPDAGYTIGATDIEKFNANGTPIPDGNNGYLQQQAKGLTAGIGAGYIFPGSISFNIGLRYQHVFVSGDPSLNMFSLRLSHSFSFGRRND
ncbi:MAG TPA: outer membrane beta-barrel protein [Flavisolibacter sp.]|nr:outer membrane beta-barrel protein [Flavisolibacter sp.]